MHPAKICSYQARKNTLSMCIYPVTPTAPNSFFHKHFEIFPGKQSLGRFLSCCAVSDVLPLRLCHSPPLTGCCFILAFLVCMILTNALPTKKRQELFSATCLNADFQNNDQRSCRLWRRSAMSNGDISIPVTWAIVAGAPLTYNADKC